MDNTIQQLKKIMTASSRPARGLIMGAIQLAEKAMNDNTVPQNVKDVLLQIHEVSVNLHDSPILLAPEWERQLRELNDALLVAVVDSVEEKLDTQIDTSPINDALSDDLSSADTPEMPAIKTTRRNTRK